MVLQTGNADGISDRYRGGRLRRDGIGSPLIPDGTASHVTGEGITSQVPRDGILSMSVFKQAAIILIVGSTAAFSTAGLLAVVLAIVDLYLAGHSLPPLSRPWISIPEWGVSMSRADTIFLGGVAAAALASGIWTATLVRKRRD